MIKFKLRKNLLYLLAYYISWYLRKIIDIIIYQVFNIYPTYTFLYLMVLGEIIGGATLYFYQYNSQIKNKEIKYFRIHLIYNTQKIIVEGGSLKIGLLIFLAGFYDFFEFIYGSLFIPLINPNISSTIEGRLGFMETIASSIIYTYVFQIKLKRHQKATLIIMGLCLLLTIIVEIIFKPENISIVRFLSARFLICYYLIGNSLNNCIEKHLVDINFLNPFKILMLEGTFEVLMAIFISIGKEPFKELIIQYKDNATEKFILLIFLLFIHLLLSISTNVYKIYCNVVYSPMARELIDYLMGPNFIIYYFIQEDDFQNNYFYFFTCEIINIVIVFFSCVYNEYIILFCFNLEHNTKDEIIERA